ncbi:Division abnormally delayed protein [Gryllus bimaculatus]|nr:Division abnormally delayed protein [Gryllus bimaculatus]
MERRLTVRSRREFDRALAAALAPLAETLRARATRFDEYFKTMLSTSKRDFHDMFRRTYGIIYEQNSFVFTDLFDELERYYLKGRVDLEEALDNFFSTLYQKMFTVINAQYRFDDSYLRCVGEHMAELKPFGDVPAKLSVQLRRAFVATRTFAQSLSIASDAVTNMAKIPPSPECLRALTKMSGCPTCTGLVEVKACNNYCINVMKGCLTYHTQLNNEWNAFVDALDQLVERLKGPFNIEIVVNPINIKISEAIMNFQESGTEVSHRVFQGCGKPKLGRRRRRDTTELDFGRHSHRPGNHRDREETEDEVTLETLVKDIRVKVNDTRQFWANLPYQVCNDDKVAASPALDDSCWNGEKKARYEVQVSKEQRANPEVSVDPSRESVHLNEQLYVLRTLISKLKSAYVGRDVEWIDNEDSTYGSGSGSGDGGSDRNDPDNDSEPEGSGDDDYHDRRYGGYDPSSGRPDPNRPLDPRNNHPDHPSGPGSSGATHPRLSPARAVSSYLLPIVVVWFGGLFSDWL